MKKAFTLIEVTIVLVVLGILSAVIFPIVKNSIPDENIIKFKKSYNAFNTVIAELLMSDKYFANGNFAQKIDGSYMLDDAYFCNNFSNFFIAKELRCKSRNLSAPLAPPNFNLKISGGLIISSTNYDSLCLEYQQEVNWTNVSYILTTDGIYYYFPISLSYASGAEAGGTPYKITDVNGIKGGYGAICIDVDGINTGEDPFGIAMRDDGKLQLDARAQEWLEKRIKNK